MSSYSAFDVLIDNNDGTQTAVPGATVHVYDVTNAAALADVVADGSGHVTAGTLAVAVGTLIRFWVNLGNGRVGYAEVVTT